jgi:hypothetical protein
MSKYTVVESIDTYRLVSDYFSFPREAWEREGEYGSGFKREIDIERRTKSWSSKPLDYGLFQLRTELI